MCHIEFFESMIKFKKKERKRGAIAKQSRASAFSSSWSGSQVQIQARDAK